MMCSILYKPEGSRFAQAVIDKAIDMAPKIIEVEQELRIGETSTKIDGTFEPISAIKYFIFDKTGEIYPIWGETFGPAQDHPQFDSKAQMSLIVKLFVRVLNSSVVLQVTEVWAADKCHICEKSYYDCPCKVQPCKPRDNPFSKEMLLLCSIIYYDGEEKSDDGQLFGSYTWMYEMLRDENDKVTGFNPIEEGKQSKISGRMVEHWVIHKDENPHFALNYPQFCDALGVECPNDVRQHAAMAHKIMPKTFQLLSWNITTSIDEVVAISKEAHKRAMSEFN